MNQLLARTSLLGLGLLLLSYNVLADDYKPKITHGVASGDITTDSVVIWSRADRASTMNVKISGETKGKKHKSQRVSAVDDFTGKIQYSGLKPNTRYEYEVWFGMHSKKQQSNRLKGSFKTAPRQHHKSAVDFAWGGDLAGQNVCRDSASGFPIFNAINSSKLDFFIGLGDMIYADGLCESKGRYGNTQIAGDFRLDTTWKIIVSSVPISIPTGFPANKGRDGWANFDQTTGFERELVDIFDHMYKKGERNIVFITTDVHFAEVFRYTPFADRPEFKVHEYVTGPLNAGLFPNRNFDDSLGTESLFFYGPESSDAVTTHQQALPWMNYGAASIDKEGVLTLSVRDVDGNIRYQAEHVPNR